MTLVTVILKERQLVEIQYPQFVQPRKADKSRQRLPGVFPITHSKSIFLSNLFQINSVS